MGHTSISVSYLLMSNSYGEGLMNLSYKGFNSEYCEYTIYYYMGNCFESEKYTNCIMLDETPVPYPQFGHG